jgi:dGTPase
LVNEKYGKATAYNRLILGMIGSDSLNFEGRSVYDLLLHACSLVASLSDGAAVHMHNKITGKQL